MCGKMRNFAPDYNINNVNIKKNITLTPAEYIQLKAFARIDGALLSVLWVASFACYIAGIANPIFSMAAMILMFITPFFVGRCLAKFRDVGLGGIISFGRGWGYAVYVFFYAAILLAVAQYIYFAYMDQGYLISSFNNVLASPEVKQLFDQYGVRQAVTESIESMSQLRPIDYALNVLTMNIFVGIILGLPIAALMKRSVSKP